MPTVVNVPLQVTVHPLESPILGTQASHQAGAGAFGAGTYSGMTMGQAVKTVFRKYAQFEGRATRSEFWFFSLFSYLIIFAIVTLGFIVGMSANSADAATMMMTIMMIIWALLIFIPSIAVTVRRLHDAGYSGWMYLIWLIPYLGSFVLFIFSLLVSQPVSNRWGPAPTQAPAGYPDSYM